MAGAWVLIIGIFVSVVAYFAKTLVLEPILEAPIRIYVFAFIILFTVAVFLFRGSRIAWVLVVLGNGVAVVSVLFRGEWWWGLFYLALLVLLFMPEARRHIWRQRF